MGGRGASTGGTDGGGTYGGAGAAPGGSSGGGGRVGSGGSGGSAGASGMYCSPCVSSSDCASGVHCVGGLNPRCGKACTVDGDCGVNASSGSCAIISTGGLTPSPGSAGTPGAAGILVRSCLPADSVCGTGRTRDGLSCNDTWNNYAKSFFSSTCIGSCHRHDATFDTVDKVRTSADAIHYMVDSGAMPQGQTLSDTARRRLLTWLACGAM